MREKTFAQRARELEKRFPRHKFDTIEKRDFESALEKLADEQESYRESKGLNTKEAKFEEGGLLPITPIPISHIGEATPITKVETSSIFNSPENREALNNFSTTNLNSLNNTSINTNSSLIPSYASAGISVLGNLGQMALDKKPSRITASRYTPQRLNLNQERQRLINQATTSGNITRRNIRNLSGGVGMALSNLGAAEAGIQRTLGDSLSRLGTQEEEYNTSETNQAIKYNTESKARADLTNQQMREAWRQRRLGYLAGAVGTIPEFMKDVSNIKEQDRRYDLSQEQERNRLKILQNMTRYGNFQYSPSGAVIGANYTG